MVLRQIFAVILIMVLLIQVQFVAIVALATLIDYLLIRPFPKLDEETISVHPH